MVGIGGIKVYCVPRPTFHRRIAFTDSSDTSSARPSAAHNAEDPKCTIRGIPTGHRIARTVLSLFSPHLGGRASSAGTRTQRTRKADLVSPGNRRTGIRDQQPIGLV